MDEEICRESKIRWAYVTVACASLGIFRDDALESAEEALRNEGFELWDVNFETAYRDRRTCLSLTALRLPDAEIGRWTLGALEDLIGEVFRKNHEFLWSIVLCSQCESGGVALREYHCPRHPVTLCILKRAQGATEERLGGERRPVKHLKENFSEEEADVMIRAGPQRTLERFAHGLSSL